MAVAQIRWAGAPGPVSNLVVGTPVLITNNNDGTETSWVYTLVRKPASSTAVLVAVVPGTVRLTPDKPGTYIVRLVVNGTYWDVSSGAALWLPSLLREPALGETKEWGSTGWAEATQLLFQLLNHRVQDPVAPRPAASAAVHGRIWHTLGAGAVDDAFEACLQDAGGGYTWYSLVMSPSLLLMKTKVLDHTGVGWNLALAEVVPRSIIHCNSFAGVVNPVLPSLGAAQDGTECTFKRVESLGGSLVTITPGAGNTIEAGGNVLDVSAKARRLVYIHALTKWVIA